MAYNVSRQSTTGYLPLYQMFGRQSQLPIDVMYSTPDHPKDTVPEYVSKLRGKFSKLLINRSVYTKSQMDRKVIGK